MRASRAPEGRGSAGKRVLILSFVVVSVLVLALGIYFAAPFGSLSAKDQQSEAPKAVQQPPAAQVAKPVVQAPTSTPRPTATPRPTRAPAPTPVAVVEPKSEEKIAAAVIPEPPQEVEAAPQQNNIPPVLPDADFGEVLEEGLVEVKLPNGELADTWYSFQVDTKSREITLFYALYDDELETLISTVKLNNYTRDHDLTMAEVTLFYTDGSDRILEFDSDKGTISLLQRYPVPHEPSMFSADLRRGLVYYGMDLRDEDLAIEVQLHLDLSGLSKSEALEFKRSAPQTVEAALAEIKALVDQIEERRVQS
jgi:hypothetical protein